MTDEVEALAAFSSFALSSAPERLKDDKEVVLLALINNGLALREASERLKDDKEVVLRAVGFHPFALFYASERLKDNKEVALIAVKGYGYILNSVSNLFRNDSTAIVDTNNVELDTLNKVINQNVE